MVGGAAPKPPKFLRFAVVEDDGTILRTFVRTLAVQCGRVVCLPEHVEQFFIRNFRRVKLDLCDFGVACIAGSNLHVGRVWCLAAREAAGDGDDAW